MVFNTEKKLKIIGLIFVLITFINFIDSIPILEIYLASTSKGYLTSSTTNQVTIYEVARNSPASIAGLQKGDIINRANNKNVTSTENYIELVTNNNKIPISLEVLRENKTFNVEIVPRTNYPPNEGPTGLVISDNQLERENVALSERLVDAIAKPYLGYESIPQSSAGIGGPVSMYFMLGSNEYISYEYTGNFKYLINLLVSIILLFTTIGILKRKRYGAFLSLLLGVYALIVAFYSVYSMIRFQSINIILIYSLILSILFFVLGLYVFSKRNIFT